jgi:ATP-dependent exoDNAse (exonuclease V) beta subunit
MSNETFLPTLFHEIEFDAKAHRYFYRGGELMSATKFLKRFQPPFDQKNVAQRVAAKSGRSVEAIIAEWERSGERSRALGTAVHAHIENVLAAVQPIPTGPIHSEFEQWLALWETDLRKTFRPAQVEWVIGDHHWALAGTVDALLHLDYQGTYHLFDWKTGKFETSNPWQTLNGPFSHLDDCQMNRYSLQLSLYRLMIERNTTISLGDSYLVHLMPDDSHIYTALDLRPQLSDYLTRNPPVIPSSIFV